MARLRSARRWPQPSRADRITSAASLTSVRPPGGLRGRPSRQGPAREGPRDPSDRIERKVQGRDEPESETIQGDCATVRSALTDDGRPKLEASGLKLADRLTKVASSL